MNEHKDRLCRAAVGTLALIFSLSAGAVEFVYDTTFKQSNGIITAEFPLAFSNVSVNNITSYQIYRLNGTTQTDVTTLGCATTSTSTPTFSFIASAPGTNTTFTATCGNNIPVGAQARLSVSVNQTQPLVLVAGPRIVGVNAVTKLSWSHSGDFFQCQPFTFNGQNSAWSPANFALTSQLSSPQGSTNLIASSFPRTVSFALQCIPSTFFGMPPLASVNVTVQ
ncbi:MAG: hypothetical protein HY272_10465 [Gammaproteobacteria bacterium]|nr:hypothetical protein [Gammaproteobacteria bacterium]